MFSEKSEKNCYCYLYFMICKGFIGKEIVIRDYNNLFHILYIYKRDYTNVS